MQNYFFTKGRLLKNMTNSKMTKVYKCFWLTINEKSTFKMQYDSMTSH